MKPSSNFFKLFGLVCFIGVSTSNCGKTTSSSGGDLNLPDPLVTTPSVSQTVLLPRLGNGNVTIVGGTFDITGPTSGWYSFQATLKNASGDPLANQPVTIDFSNATGIRLMKKQMTGVVVDCTAKTVTAETNSNGYVTFTPSFGGYDTSGVITIRSGDIALFENAFARSTDFDGINGTNGNDLSLMLAELNGSNTQFDLTLDGYITSSDVDIFTLSGWINAIESEYCS